MSLQRKFIPSQTIRRIICKSLDEDVTIYVLVSDASKDTKLDETLQRYESLSNHIKVSYINPAANPTFAAQYTDSSVTSNSMIVVSSERSRVIDYNDVYSFITQDFEKFFSCIVEFDYKNLVVNFYRVENFGEETNVTIGYRNVQNSHDITVDDENVYTKYRVSGADDLGIEQCNGGSNTLFYLDPFWLNNKYLSNSTIEKYKAWFSFCEQARVDYSNMSKEWNTLQDKITEIYIRIPTGDCDPDNWHSLSDTALEALKKDYEAQKLGYEKIYVDEDGNFDIDALNASPDANMYHQIVDTILPNIQIEFDNRKLPTSEGEKDYIEDYETTWKYYGINELEVKLKSYQDQAKLLAKSHYDLTWERYQELTKEDPEKYPALTEDGFKDKHELYEKNCISNRRK